MVGNYFHFNLSKEFDTLDHGILLTKLENNGIRGSAYSLKASYLTERKQFVHVNSTSSDTLGIRYGVPQGSILWPLLFLFILYMNDIMNCLPDLGMMRLVLYADDRSMKNILTRKLLFKGLSFM